MVPPAVRVYVCAQPADMRRSFDGLAAMARDVVRQDPLSGHLFVFCNRKTDRVKVLWWDRSGLCLWYKRLERGLFRFPRHNATTYELEAAELTLILEGIELAGAKRRPRFEPRVISPP
jgi:transposase